MINLEQAAARGMYDKKVCHECQKSMRSWAGKLDPCHCQEPRDRRRWFLADMGIAVCPLSYSADQHCRTDKWQTCVPGLAPTSLLPSYLDMMELGLDRPRQVFLFGTLFSGPSINTHDTCMELPKKEDIIIIIPFGTEPPMFFSFRMIIVCLQLITMISMS